MKAISLNPKKKVAVFVSLLMLFALLGGPEFGARPVQRLFLVFCVGGAVALWSGREEISAFRPTTLTFWSVLFGSVVMIWSLAMLIFIRLR